MTKKKEKEIKQYSSITTIDPESNKAYKFQNNKIEFVRLEKFDKNSFYISILSSKDIIIDSVDISRNISEEDIYDAIELRIYEELNLDPAIEYTIHYEESLRFEERNLRRFNIFAIQTDKIKEIFSETIKKIRYIDYILPEPLLIKSLYIKSLIEKESIDCFLYFKRNDAFLTIYVDGEYIYAKSLNYSIEKIYDKFCELCGENYPYEEFVDFIVSGQSSNISQENQKLIVKLYKEIFVYINDIIFYVKRAYGLESIDKIYVNSSIGIFKNIDRYIRTYLDIEPHELSFLIARNEKEVRNEQLHNLMILSALNYIEEPDDALNFSLFKKPPPFSQRAVGRLFYLLIFLLIVSLIYPAYEFGYAYFIKLKLLELEKKEHNLYIEATAIKNQLKRLKIQQDNIQKKYNKEFEKLSFREKILEEINTKKIHYPMKIALLIDIFKKINRYNSKLYNVDINTDKNGKIYIILSIYSRSDKSITELIKSLTTVKTYSVSTKEIRKDKVKKVYLSNIKVVLNGSI